MSGEIINIMEIETHFEEEWEKNPMREPILKAVIINACVGQSGPQFERAKTILKQITDRAPVERYAKSTLRGFQVRKGEPIAVLVTLRDEEAKEFLDRALYAVDYSIKKSSFDELGNFSFGVSEHIDIKGAEFDPTLGTIGFNVIVKLERPGYRIKYRRRKRQKVPKDHRLKPEEAMEFSNKRFNIRIIEG